MNDTNIEIEDELKEEVQCEENDTKLVVGSGSLVLKCSL